MDKRSVTDGELPEVAAISTHSTVAEAIATQARAAAGGKSRKSYTSQMFAPAAEPTGINLSSMVMLTLNKSYTSKFR